MAKLVRPEQRDQLAGGLAVASSIDRPDLPTGWPVPTAASELLADIDGCGLALLTWVDGSELTEDDQTVIGATLGRAHALGSAVDLDSAEQFHWIDLEAEHLHIRPWILPKVKDAVEALDHLPILTAGMLHADPAPEAFRYDSTANVCGLIDWGAALRGPLLYDVASAVMYVGGIARADELVSAYLHHAPMTRDEVDAGLETMLNFRWAVQADYFARRIATNGMTGISDTAENEKGLADTRAHLP